MATKSQPLIGYDRVVVSTLMPISLLWEDFLQRHEYIDNKTAMMIRPEEVMTLIDQMNRYVQSVYKRVGVDQYQWNEVAEKIVPIMYAGENPVPTSTDDHKDKESSGGEDDIQPVQPAGK